ncbi:hypothetical protein [Streptomyces sp. NPDC023838]|uniref:hypothetical protein n=1 Tax=Streptomyces sp. NPDC023838 TaxID=3154325 RepID=UPI0033CE1716
MSFREHQTLVAAQAGLEQTRDRLGERAGRLAAKADVKRAQDKAVEVTAGVQQAAAKTAHAVQEHTPEPVRQTVAKVAWVCRSHTRSVLVAGAATAVGVFVLRRRFAREGRS